MPEDAYEEFYRDRFIAFAKRVSGLLLQEAKEPVFLAAAALVIALPDEPL